MYQPEFFFIALGILIVGSLLDIYSSQNFPRYRMFEAMAYKRSADGSLNNKIDFIQLLVMIVIHAAIYFTFRGDIGLFANVLFAGFGLFRVILAFQNFSKKARNKRTLISKGEWQ